MGARSPRWIALVLLVMCVAAGNGLCQARAVAASTVISTRASAAATTTILSNHMVLAEPEFLGAYGPDGVFRKAGRALAKEPVFEAASGNDESVRPLATESFESVVNDYVPPMHASKTVAGHSLLANVRDGLLTFAYGRQKVLGSPGYITVDSRQRLIVSDPPAAAVHVLDGKNSFRIQGGPQCRLQHPSGVAVDAQDNLYVADRMRALILVYDAQGHFIREIGRLNSDGESMFQEPTAIAIDTDAGRLYVLDSPVDELLVLDLTGQLERRIGGLRSRSDGARFHQPTAIAVRDNTIAVLDSYGSRVQVFDRQGSLVSTFKTRNISREPVSDEYVGLAIDGSANIYVVNKDAGLSLAVYGQNGETIGRLSSTGSKRPTIGSPTGLWIGHDGRMYVADCSSSRVQVFQVGTEPRLSR